MHRLLRHGKVAALPLAMCLAWAAAHPASAGQGVLPPPKSIGELTPAATIRVGKTADWVAITDDAVWVASTGPFAVHRIDPKTNELVASVMLAGEPCAGLATGFGSLWVPLCTSPPTLARIDLAANRLTAVFPIGPVAPEGGVATGAGNVWLITDKAGTLARIDPVAGTIRQTLKVPAGSYNPFFVDGQIWMTRAEGSEVAALDAATGGITATVKTGPNPRFLTASDGAIWTLNQGDGTLTRIALGDHSTATIALGTPGHGGDISGGGGMIWTTMPGTPLSAIDARTRTLRCRWTGPGGDSLGIGHDAIWLTDYHGGTIARISLQDALAHCKS
jgi:virginiamycin B lyase